MKERMKLEKTKKNGDKGQQKRKNQKDDAGQKKKKKSDNQAQNEKENDLKAKEKEKGRGTEKANLPSGSKESASGTKVAVNF